MTIQIKKQVINIINQTAYNPPAKKVFQNLLQKTYKIAVRRAPPECELNLIFLSRQKMQAINAQFAGANYAANVLAFDYTMRSMKQGLDELCAEILICPQVAKAEALQLSIPVAERIKLLFAHGLLHFLGYQHKTAKDRAEMEKLEDAAMGD